MLQIVRKGFLFIPFLAALAHTAGAQRRGRQQPVGQPRAVQDTAKAGGGASYHVAEKQKLGGDGGWDYLTADPSNHRVFISRGDRVMVFDTFRDTLSGVITGTPGVHGIAVVPELVRGFTSNGGDSSVTIFDLRTLTILQTVKVTGGNPDGILYDPATMRVFTFNGGSSNATAIEGGVGQVAGTVDLGGRPEAAASDAKGRIFVNIVDKNEIVVFDAKTLAVQQHWALAPCENPAGMAIDRKNGRLFVGCRNKMMAIVETKAGHVVTTLPIGPGVDANAYDPATRLAFSSNGGDGTLTVVHEDTPDKFSVVATVPTQQGARTMALDERTHWVYLVTAEFGPPATADGATRQPRPPIIPGSFTLLIVTR